MDCRIPNHRALAISASAQENVVAQVAEGRSISLPQQQPDNAAPTARLQAPFELQDTKTYRQQLKAVLNAITGRIRENTEMT